MYSVILDITKTMLYTYNEPFNTDNDGLSLLAYIWYIILAQHMTSKLN